MSYIRFTLEPIAGQVVADKLLVVRRGFGAGFPLVGVPES